MIRMIALGCLVAAVGVARAGYDIADRAVTGSVTVVNVPWTFKGNRIDWLFNPTKAKGPFNPEWTWQLNRMYFWPELAKAYRETGDARYARAFARQAEDWLDQTGGVPTEEGYNGVGSPWRTIEEGLRLMRYWPEAWKAFKDAPAFTKPLRERFVASMRAQARHLMKHRTHQNWLLMEMTGVHAFATLFPDFPECAQYRRESARILADELRSQILPDGFQYELSPDYHIVLLNCACPLYRRAKESGHLDELPADFVKLLEKAVESQIALMTPGFVQPRSNDCYTMHTEDFAKRVEGLVPDRADFRWARTHGKEGAPPTGETASRYLPWSGFAAMRSDWSADASYLCFDVGPLGRAHYHQDKLSFSLWKGDEELVFDDGGGQYEVSSERQYGLSGYDHNTLLVDGLAQNRREPLQVTAPIDAGWETSADRDRAFGVYDQGFGPKSLRLAVHRREIVFDKRQDRFTLTDDVSSADAQEHAYELLFQIDTTNVVVSADGKSLRADYGPGRRWALSLSVVGADVRLRTASGRKTPTLAGWFIGRNDLQNHIATTVFVSAPKGLNRRFVTHLRPVRFDIISP